jgi:V-type H+-transporting ATPase subunit F
MKKATKESLIYIIGDEDTITGFLLAGIGSSSPKNYFIVRPTTKTVDVATTFRSFLADKKCGILLITQIVANSIRPEIVAHSELLPTVLEIPDKDHPYDAAADSVMVKIRKIMTIER